MAKITDMNIFKILTGRVFVSLVSIAVLLASCAAPPYRAEPLPLEKAVGLMTDDLLRQVTDTRGVLGGSAEIVMDAMIYAETGEVTRTSYRIKKVIAEQARSFSKLKVLDMSNQNVKTTNYVLVGVMHLEEYTGQSNKITRLSASVVDVVTGQIAAHSEALIADASLGYEPTQIYRDSPMYIKDKRVQSFIETAQTRAGGVANKEYIGSLSAAALLNDAEEVYNHGDYAKAIELFISVVAFPDGKIMRTYSGLYNSYYQIGRKEEAEDAFSNMVDIGLQNRELNIKFLFEFDSKDLKKPEASTVYPLYLRQLSKHILASDMCTHIIGHASKSGTEDYNKALSLKRAKEIKSKLGEQNANKTDAEGKGFSECHFCPGESPFDRRVEFKVVDCSEVDQIAVKSNGKSRGKSKNR